MFICTAILIDTMLGKARPWTGLAFSFEAYFTVTGTLIVFPPLSVIVSVVLPALASVTVNMPELDCGEAVATAGLALTMYSVGGVSIQ